MDRELAPGMASELKIIDELRRRNLPYQHRVQIDHYEVDIVVGRRIIVEVDGYVHAAKETIEKDQRKELYLHDQGFTVLRITGNEVRNRGRVRDFGRRIQELYTKEQSPLTVQNAKPLTQTLVNEGLLKLRQQLGDEELAGVAGGVEQGLGGDPNIIDTARYLACKAAPILAGCDYIIKRYESRGY